jgi:hypothetical protein
MFAIGGKHSMARPNGFTESVWADGRVTRGETWMCVHCNAHHDVCPGSGKLRGVCTRCNGYVCPTCADACVPLEQLLENLEAGRPADFRPTVVAFPAQDLPPAFTAAKG